MHLPGHERHLARGDWRAWMGQLREELDVQRQTLIGRRAPELEASHRPAWQHILVALGGPDDAWKRTRRLAQASCRLVHFGDVRQRLASATEAGRIVGTPTRAQLLFGGFDMLRFLFEPGARETDAQKGIGLPLHRLLRLLSDPVSALDPGGITSTLEQVLSHITEEFHFNPSYDLQLLETFPRGFEALQERCDAILDGSHPRAAVARKRVPRSDYHAALRTYAVAVREDPACRPPRFRSLAPEHATDGLSPMTDAERASFLAAAQALSSLWGFLDYCYKLPLSPARLARRATQVRRFPGPLSSTP